MKAISLWQPWASLWCNGIKIHDTRHWATSYRGWLLVHAAKRRIDDLDGGGLGDICNSQFGHHYGMDLPRGAIVGRVHMIACVATDRFMHLSEDDRECGDFSDYRFAWQADKFETFKEPIPYRGAQGFFEVPDDILPRAAIKIKSHEAGYKRPLDPAIKLQRAEERLCECGAAGSGEGHAPECPAAKFDKIPRTMTAANAIKRLGIK